MWILKKIGIGSKTDFFKFVLQFMKFCIVGLSNAAVTLTVYYIFIAINPKLYLAGNAIGFLLGVLNSYFWNSKFVFNNKSKKKIHSLLKAYCTYGLTLILQTVFLFVMVEILYIPEKFAPIINIILTTPINFLFNKFWVFKKRARSLEKVEEVNHD